MNRRCSTRSKGKIKMSKDKFANDLFGNRMKSYEAVTTSRKAFKGQPIIARLDGKNFSTFTKGLGRPFDKRMSDLMTRVMTKLVDETQAQIGYTQSDEITLGWFIDSSSKAEYAYGGRFQKMDSLLAATATGEFIRGINQLIPEKAHLEPKFDCRTFVVPNLLEAYHEILWRQHDCTKNAISMAAQSMGFGSRLHGLNGVQMQELMFAERGINFNDYPAFFKRGTFARRMRVFKPLDQALIDKLVAKGIKPLEGPIERSEMQISNAWLQKLEDPVGYTFKGAAETYRTEDGKLQLPVDKVTSAA